jgi:hypothetical protein
LPDAESFAQIGVEIDARHSASLGPATMRAACGVRRSWAILALEDSLGAR